MDQVRIARLVHEGWCINYVFWRDNKPFEENKNYDKPYQPLGDDRRNKCAQLKYNELDKDEQAKDIIIAEYIVSMIKNAQIDN
jgi:hypothetical protein